MAYQILIDGEDRTGDIINQSLTITDVINDQVNTCDFTIVNRSALGMPSTDEEIIITLSSGEILFGGKIVSVSLNKRNYGEVSAQVHCVDYTFLLDSNLVHKSYEDKTDKEIIEDIVATYCYGLGITTDNVVEGITLSQISFNYVQPSQAISKIAKITGRNWYIDYEKDIHYCPTTTNAAPFNIDSSSSTYANLNIKKDSTQLKNRVYVRGGTKLSDATTYSEKGDGVKRKFILPDKPHNVTVTVGGVSKTVGIKNVNTSGYDWYLNYQEKYLEQDGGATVLSDTDTLVITYQYDIPILVAQENSASILANGVREFAIFDKTISTTNAARDRAVAELTDYANDMIDGSFETYTPAFHSGQYIHVTLTDYDLDDDYLIQQVTATSIGGGVFIYTVTLASAKTVGIIKFLISLLETDKNMIELDDNEVVDELFQLNDLLLSDSLQEALTTDSAGPYSTWCTDSLQEAPSTRARWDLFQWG